MRRSSDALVCHSTYPKARFYYIHLKITGIIMSTPVSLAIKPPSGQAKKKSTWNAPSQRMFHADSDDEEGDAFASASSGRREPKSERREDERINGIGANGRALGSRRSPEPLVIAPLPNRDWRDAAATSAAALGQRRAPSYRPERRDDGPVITHERVGDEPQRRGLRKLGDNQGEDYEDRKPDEKELAAVKVEVKEEIKEEVKVEAPRNLDEEALAAVLAGEMPSSAAERRAAELVIQSAENSRGVLSAEDQALERDLNILPSESTLEDYDAIPVEAFGAAMLRGMGYDPKNDTPMHIPKPRPALLGIGATALSSELPPTRTKDPKKRREDAAKRGGRGYNAAGLLVRSDSRATSRETSAAASRATSPGREKRRREDDDGRESKRRDDRDRRYDSDRERERDRRRDDRGDSKSRYDDRDRDDRDRKRSDRDRDGRRYETEEERARRKARERERERDGGRDRRDDRERERDRDRYRRDDRDRDRSRYDDKDRRDRDRR